MAVRLPCEVCAVSYLDQEIALVIPFDRLEFFPNCWHAPEWFSALKSVQVGTGPCAVASEAP